jgi:hypothetical protein
VVNWTWTYPVVCVRGTAVSYTGQSLLQRKKVKEVFIMSASIFWSNLKWKRRVIMKTEHEIMLFGSYLTHSSSILLWGLVASFRAKDLRLSTWFRSSREHVCLSDEFYSLIHALVMFLGGEFSSYIHDPLMFVLLNYLPIHMFCLYV